MKNLPFDYEAVASEAYKSPCQLKYTFKEGGVSYALKCRPALQPTGQVVYAFDSEGKQIPACQEEDDDDDDYVIAWVREPLTEKNIKWIKAVPIHNGETVALVIQLA